MTRAFNLVIIALAATIGASAQAAPKKTKYAYICGDFSKGKYVQLIPAFGEITGYNVNGKAIPDQILDGIEVISKNVVIPSGPSSSQMYTQLTFQYPAEAGQPAEVIAQIRDTGAASYLVSQEYTQGTPCGKLPISQ
jgi:hypothetical protein